MAADATDDGDGDGGEWRFGVDEVGEDAEPLVDPIEPGSPSAENTAFFLLGVVTMVVALGLLLFG
ncbi:DUF7312 domain-containing protein [Halobacterium litoreum]|uniref:DUF7312 domain-containing protein n=1 Tax=Halobacterium litoreum TaxID=2039234 RepID=A0ABD5NH43_9EURY|nr:hypothetical protein [Halobacterium litoreum]UHH12718.1 hypothetical protein LT972_11175 [Halobacterium litoreum]